MNKKNIFISIIALVVILLLTIYVLPWIIAIAAAVYVVIKVKSYITGRKEKEVFVEDKSFDERDKIKEKVVDVDYKPL